MELFEDSFSNLPFIFNFLFEKIKDSWLSLTFLVEN